MQIQNVFLDCTPFKTSLLMRLSYGSLGGAKNVLVHKQAIRYRVVDFCNCYYYYH